MNSRKATVLYHSEENRPNMIFKMQSAFNSSRKPAQILLKIFPPNLLQLGYN